MRNKFYQNSNPHTIHSKCQLRGFFCRKSKEMTSRPCYDGADIFITVKANSLTEKLKNSLPLVKTRNAVNLETDLKPQTTHSQK